MHAIPAKAFEAMRRRWATDIADGRTVHLIDGWHALEVQFDHLFRWVDNDAVFELPNERAGAVVLSIDVEPGPSLGGGPLRLNVLDRAGNSVSGLQAVGRRQFRLRLPPSPVAPSRFILRAEGGGMPVPRDPRRLNFRVFRLAAHRAWGRR
jgi:hypothetical protein